MLRFYTDAGRNFGVRGDGPVVTPPVPAPDPGPVAGEWYYDKYAPPAEGRTWKILQSHDTGHVTQTLIDQRYDTVKDGAKPWHRVRMDAAPDGMPAFREDLTKGLIVAPLNFVAPRVPWVNKHGERYHLRFHEWVTGYTKAVEEKGKRDILMGGLGWIARGYVINPDSNLKPSQAYGSTDGWGGNIMLGTRRTDGADASAGLVSYKNHPSVFGDSIRQDGSAAPLGQWNVFDIVADMGPGGANGSYKIYMNSVLRHSINGVFIPQVSVDLCKCLCWKVRKMIGGNPDQEPMPGENFTRWSGGYFLSVSS